VTVETRATEQIGVLSSFDVLMPKSPSGTEQITIYSMADGSVIVQPRALPIPVINK